MSGRLLVCSEVAGLSMQQRAGSALPLPWHRQAGSLQASASWQQQVPRQLPLHMTRYEHLHVPVQIAMDTVQPA